MYMFFADITALQIRAKIARYSHLQQQNLELKVCKFPLRSDSVHQWTDPNRIQWSVSECLILSKSDSLRGYINQSKQRKA